MKSLCFALSIVILFCSGCARPGLHLSSFLGIPSPRIDQPFHSVEYYESTYNINIFEKQHSIGDELRTVQEATAECNKIYSHLKINGKSPKCKDNTQLYVKSRAIGNNDYIIKCPLLPALEKQDGDGACWAASVQVLVGVKYRKHIDQSVIIEKIKETDSKEYKDQAGSVVDMLRALGIGGLSVYPNGSYELLESLGTGLPVMIGLYNKEKNERHVVVAVAARYSFTTKALPFCFTCGKFAFSELYVYDPATGTIQERKATDIEGDIAFLIAFS